MRMRRYSGNCKHGDCEVRSILSTIALMLVKRKTTTTASDSFGDHYKFAKRAIMAQLGSHRLYTVAIYFVMSHLLYEVVRRHSYTALRISEFIISFRIIFFNNSTLFQY